jgi:hypothetical protein
MDGTMRPSKIDLSPSPRRWAAGWARPLAFVLAVTCSGCSSFWSDSSPEADREARMRKLMEIPEPPELIRDAAIAHGMSPLEIDGVGVVNGLAGTGGPADPSGYRDQLLEEMKRRDVVDPNHFLERPETAMVRVRATIPPGARRGDSVDIRLLAPKQSQVSDLHSGWLLDTRLRQQKVLQNAIRQSDVMGIGTGHVLTRADHTPGTDESLRIEGNVIGGGRVQVTRKLGLILRPKYKHAKLAKALADAINRRFFFFDGTTRRGIAKPLEDDYIELDVHPRYRANLPRMMEVVRAVGGEGVSSDTQARLTELAGRLGDPATAADAALQLESLGDSAVPTLIEGLSSSNPELRFYAAEALAYLDRIEAIDPLESSGREVPAFRYSALVALQGLDAQLAIDALRRLMNEPSLETRYGSFCAIRRRINGKRALGGQMLESFWLYEVPSTAPAAVVVSLRESPEIVLLGSTSPVDIPIYLMAPGGLILKPETNRPDQLRISKFEADKVDQRAIVSNSVASMIRGIVDVGGGYGDVITVLRLAKDKGYLSDQLAIDPLPKSLRTYYRQPVDEKADTSPDEKADEADEEAI